MVVAEAARHLCRRALELLSEEQHREDVDRIAARPVLFMHLLLELLESIPRRRAAEAAGRRGGGGGGGRRRRPSHPVATGVLERCEGD